MKRTNLSAVAVWIAAFVLLLFSSSNALSQTDKNASNQDAELGQKLYREGRYFDAVDSLKKAVKLNPNDGNAWYYLGLSWLRADELKNSTKAFERAIKLQPNSAAAHSGLAYSLVMRSKLKDGLKESQRAVALDSNSAEAHFVLGLSYLHTGAREKALNEADDAIRLKPDFADAYLLKSQALVQFASGAIVQSTEPPEDRANRYQEAVSALEAYLQLGPASADKRLWGEQLAALKFHLAMRSKETRAQNDVYTSKDVTTKVRLIAKPEPEYTAAARSNTVRGTVVLKALFASDGTVKHIVVVYGLPHGLTWQSVRAARNIRFEPATLNGRPVSMFIQLEYNFNIF